MTTLAIPPAGMLFFVLDYETSGLNRLVCEILEVGARLLDSRLNEVIAAPLMLPPTKESAHVDVRVQPVTPLVVGVNAEQQAVDMHIANGLFDRWELAKPLATVENEILAGFDAMGLVDEGRNSRVHLVGRNPSFDRAFMERLMPRLHARLHYRQIDVDTLELVAAMALGVSTAHIREAFKGPHRALADVDSTLAELRMFAGAMYHSREHIAAACGIKLG